MRPAQECGGDEPLLSLKLQLQQFKPRIRRACNPDTAVVYDYLSRIKQRRQILYRPKRHLQLVRDQFLAFKGSERPRPGLKPAPAVPDPRRRMQLEIHAP